MRYPLSPRRALCAEAGRKAAGKPAGEKKARRADGGGPGSRTDHVPPRTARTYRLLFGLLFAFTLPSLKLTIQALFELGA